MSTPTLLWVDDSSLDVMMIQRALLRPELDLTLVVARNGQEALHLLRGHPGQEPLLPKAVILDLSMPGMHGFDLLVALREDSGFQNLPIVIFSSSAQSSDIAEARRLGATDYVQKPLEPLAFRVTVRALVQKWTQDPSAYSSHDR